MNNVSLILTRDSARKLRLHEVHARQPMILQAPLLVTIVADCYRTRRWLARGAARDNFNNLLGYHIAFCDAMIVAQNIYLGLEARGMGACYMGSTLTAMNEIAEILELPDTCAPVATIVAGYPDEDPIKRDRLPIAALIHEEVYRAPSDDRIDAIYAEREKSTWSRYTSTPADRERLEQSGIQTVAQLYCSSIKYDPDTFLTDSQKLNEFLTKQHFLS
ncbi:hypothetical protein WL92_27135 [Burkholderia multivorans]|nr:hypothetical protein WL91_06965 [Burkholderia multivorans]KWF74023.1 hypothetical protein WL92_27135 [Burkholderia multivorans]